MNTQNYPAYSLSQIVQAVTRIGFKEVEFKNFPNKPLVVGPQPIVFTPTGSSNDYVIYFASMETTYFRDGSLGVIVKHCDESESREDIRASVIEMSLYEVDETDGGESIELAFIQFYSTSRGAKAVVSVGDQGTICGNMVAVRTKLSQIISFLDGFIGIVPEPPHS